MKKLTYALALCGLATASSAAFAEDSSLSGNIGISTDYVFRGITQTVNKPEVSGGFDYAAGNGLYIGTWLSNQTWVEEGNYKRNSSLEVDLYGGFRGSITDNSGFDIGAITYYYPGTKISGVKSPDTTEVYLALTWGFLTLKDSYTVSQNFIGWYDYSKDQKTRGSNYVELNANFDLGDGWGLLGHVGHQTIKHANDVADSLGTHSPNYTDYKVGLSKDIGYGTVTLAYTNSNAHSDAYTYYDSDGHKHDWSKPVVALSFSKSF